MKTQTLNTQDNTQENKEVVITQSIEPSIKEIERFLLFLNKKFNLGLNFDNITILISQAHKNTLGYFSPNGFKNDKENLSGLVLNSIHLKTHPYETIAHELAHYYNNQMGIKDTSQNGKYHNKKFKATAEMLLLSVAEPSDNRGYTYTSETTDFLSMLQNEFKPDTNAFNIKQLIHEKAKKPSRLFKFVCDCGFIIRTGRLDLKATCEYCNTEFKQNCCLNNNSED